MSIRVKKLIDEGVSFEAPKGKVALLCSNGFMTTDTHDCLALKEYFDQQFKAEHPEFEVVPVTLFEASIKKTHHHKLYQKRYEEKIEEYISKGYRLVLLGYSFSCALTAKMARKYQENVDKVILVAPIYDCIMNNMIPGYLKFASKFNKLKKKYGKKLSRSLGRDTVKGMIGLLISIFCSILKNRKHMRKISQPTLLLRGNEDTICSEHTINKVRSFVSGHSAYIEYDKMTHTCMKTVRLNGVLFEDALHFTFATPLLIEQDEELCSNKKEREAFYDEEGEKLLSFDEIFAFLDPDSSDTSTALDELI